jgi:ligand-binding SRPBCC domain-containing protein
VTVYTLKRTQFIGRPLKDVFAFFEKPENLARLTPKSVGFEILTPTPIVMRTGTTVDYTIKVFGVRRFWTTLITDYDPPYRFVDVQLKGPYAFWHHTHQFEETRGGSTIHDTVRYVLPCGPLGWVMHRLLVRHQLRRIFDYRANVIASLFNGSRP